MDIPIRFVEAFIVEVECDVESCTIKPHMVEHTRFRLPDGRVVEDDELRPGDAYIDPWSARRQATEGTHSCAWSNCDGQHLIVHCPDPDNPSGHYWNVDSRCRNCALPDDTVHRCWVRTGDPKVAGSLTVGKGGVTCAAGAGSILFPGYHGFLKNGVLTGC